MPFEPMRSLSWLMESPTLYRLWQAPFAEQKFAPILAHNDLKTVHRVLDVGCGPGTNAHHFRGVDYLGFDINPDYIAQARRRHEGEFIVADATDLSFSAAGTRYDFILINSLLHHLSTGSVRRLLANLAPLLDRDGHIHILDLLLPEPSFAWALARLDRGAFPRPLIEWQRIFEEVFEPVVLEPYAVSGLRIPLWHMVYLKGRRT